MPGYTDLIYTQFYVFVEGIEIPFESVSISTGYQQLPQATIEIFPFKSMEIINRFYNPKVHIFYADEEEDGELKVIFTGHIQSSSYDKRTSGQGAQSITYQCVHRYALLNQVTLSFTSLNKDQTVYGQGDGSQVRAPVGSTSFIFSRALQGINGVGGGIPIKGTKSAVVPDATDVDKLPAYLDDPFYRSRYAGMTGSLMYIWNQFKFQANAPSSASSSGYNQAMTELYIPLVEQGLESSAGSGLRFLNRMSGIPTIDGELQATPITDAEGNTKYLPPNLRTFASEIDGLIATMTARDQTVASGETVSFWDMIERFIAFIEYQGTCLTSPAKVSAEHDALDYLVTPRLTCYFSPSCNIVYPNMFDMIRIQDNSGSAPTRMEGKSLAAPEGSEVISNFRSPPSVRNALLDKYGGDLLATTRNLSDAVGKYEFGRGVIPQVVQLPTWVNSLDSTILEDQLSPSESEKLTGLSKSYVEQYGSDYDIWSPVSRNSFKWAAMDLRYFNAAAAARSGSISGPFNPYIVPGFPMDVLDNDDGCPSYHAFCMSVSHTITPGSCETNVTFTAALTYEELANYRTPSVNPWLSSALQVLEGQWIGNKDAKSRADAIYQELFGVVSVDPADIYDFKNHELYPFYISDEGNALQASHFPLLDENAQDVNLWTTYQGNLKSASRPIESITDIETSFNLKLIRAEEQTGTVNGYPLIYYSDQGLQIKEFGQSLFLDYTQTADEARQETSDTEPSNEPTDRR